MSQDTNPTSYGQTDESFMSRLASMIPVDYDPMSTLSLRPTQMEMESETLVVDGVSLHLDYRSPYYGGLEATMRVEFDDIPKLQSLPSLPRLQSYRLTVCVMLNGEEFFTIYSCYSLDMLLRHYETHRRERAVKDQQSELEHLLTEVIRRCAALTEQGLPTDKLKAMLPDARASLLQMASWYRPTTYDVVLSKIRAAQKEADRLQTCDRAEMLVDALVDGTIVNEHTLYNERVRQEVEVFAIRSGNVLRKEVTEDALRDFYRQKLNGEPSVYQLDCYDLRVDANDYMFTDAECAELGIELAPRTVQIEGKGGLKTYGVTYSYANLDGKKVPTGAITIPFSVFKKRAAEHGKKADFPTLGHGIVLWLSVKVANGKFVSGLAEDKNLIGRVEKRNKGLGRMADGLSDEAATPAPPWAHGQAARNRRR